VADLLVRQARALSEEELAFCERSIPAAFDEVVASDPDAPALDGEERATYGELAAAADRVASGLLERLGARPEPVGLAFRSQRELVGTLLGVLRAGKIAMPIDPAAPPSRVAAMLADSGAGLVLGDLDSRGGRTILSPDALDGADMAGVECSADSGSPSLLIYTSGSTGEPKGLVLGHGTVLHSVLTRIAVQRLVAGSRVGLLYPPAFAAAYLMTFATLISGGTLLRYRAEERGLSELPRWLERHEVASVSLVSSALRPLALAAGSRGLPTIRALGLGAEPLSPSDAELARRLLAPGAHAFHSYGATEAGMVGHRVLDDPSIGAGSGVALDTLYPGKVVRLVDVEDGIGEIVVSSRYLAHGYWRREQDTVRVFRVDPVSGERACRTGDMGRVDEHGRLMIVGRRDRMVKIAGKRVQLDAIEHALLADDRVREAAVLARRRTNGSHTLVGYLTPRSGTVDRRAVKERLRAALPPYMVPSRIVALDAMPRVPNGKIDRRALADAQMSAVTGMPASAATPPASDIERRLVEIWQELLEVPVGVGEDFFDLGGDSLLAMELLIEIEERLGCSLTPEALLETPTIRGLAKTIRFPRALTYRAPSDRPPLFAVYGMGGNGLRYRGLADALGEEFPLCRLEAPWWDGRAHRIRTMEQLAAFHIPQIQRVQPTGPYLLVGNSSGGLLGLEIARQLAAAGQEIAMLGAFDTSLDITVRRRPAPGDPRTWPMEAPRTTAHRIRRWLWMRWAMQRYGTTELRNRLLFARARMGWWLDLHRHGAVPERHRGWYSAYHGIQAIRNYRPAPYDGRVVLVRCTQTPGPRDLGWGAVARGGLEILDLDSHHDEILTEPHVRELASKLAPLIREAWDEMSPQVDTRVGA
jgi:acyl-coenzyme A synthetase/AMP-(fatty) acid ligase/thioesterase domain-containing protein/acyl carrier protein